MEYKLLKKKKQSYKFLTLKIYSSRSTFHSKKESQYLLCQAFEVLGKYSQLKVGISFSITSKNSKDISILLYFF